MWQSGRSLQICVESMRASLFYGVRDLDEVGSSIIHPPRHICIFWCSAPKLKRVGIKRQYVNESGMSSEHRAAIHKAQKALYLENSFSEAILSQAMMSALI